MPSDDDKKRYLFLLLIGAIVVALVISIFAKNVLAASPADVGFSYTQLQTSIDQCNAQLKLVATQTADTQKNCIVSTERVNHLSDGFKFYVLGALGLSVALNAGLTYYLLRKKREPTKQMVKDGEKVG